MMHVGRSGDAPSRSQQPSDIADNVNHNNNNNDDNNNDNDNNTNNNNNINLANYQQNKNNDLINALENKFDDKVKTREGIYNDFFDKFKSDNNTTILDNDSKGIANLKRPNRFNTHTVNSIEPLCTTNELATTFITGDVLDSNTEKSQTNVDQTKRENLKKNDFYHFKTATELFQSNFLSESSCCLTKTTSSLRPSHSVDFLSFVCRQHLLLQQQKYKILFPDTQQTIKKLTGEKISSSLQNKVERTTNNNTTISKEIPKTKKTRSDSQLLCNKKNSLDTESFIFKSDKDFKILQTPAGICEKDSTEKDISKQSNQDTESITSAVDMPVSYCYIRPSGSYVSVRNSKRSSSRHRKSSAVLSPSSSFTSFDESLASILDPLYRRSRHSSQKRSSSAGNKRMELAVKSAFAMTLFSLMAGVVLTVCGFVRLEGWTDEQQLPMKILGPTCLTSTFVVWGVGGLFLYLWRSEWKREKQAMDLKTRVQFHAIAVDLLKKSTSNIGSPSNASILQSERKRRRKLITKLKQQEVLEMSSNETSRPSSRTQSIDSRYHRNSTCSANSNLISSLIDKAAAAVVNGGSCGGGGGSNGSNSSKMRRKKILVPAVFDIPGIQISRIETIDFDDASDKSGKRTLELVVGGRSNKNKKDSTASISSVGSTTANHYHHNGRHYHQQNGSSSFSRRYIIVKSSDASSDYSRFSDYSLVEAMSRSRSSRSSRDSSNFSGSQKLYDMSSSPYNSQLDIDDDEEDDNENNEKSKKSHGRDYSLLTPSIPRKGSVVTFDVSDSNVRRHSSPVPSLRRKDLTEAGSRKLDEDEAAAHQDNQKNQITEISNMSTPPSTNQRYVTTSSHKPHLLTAARHKSSSQSQTRKRSCDQSLPTIFITPIATSGSTVSHEAAPTAEHLPMTSLRVSDSSLHSEQKISNTPEKEENNKKLEFETEITNLNNSFSVHHHTVSNEDLCCEVTRDTGSTPTAPAPSISSPSSTKCSFGRKYGVWSPETDSHSCCFSMQHQQQPPSTFQQHRKPQQHCYRKSSLNLQFGQHETKPRTSQSIKKPARISYHSDIFPHLENVETSYTPTNFPAGADSGKTIHIAQLKEKTSPRYSASSKSQSSKSLHRGLRKESAHVGRNFSVKQKNNNHNDDKKNDDAESKIEKQEG